MLLYLSSLGPRALHPRSYDALARSAEGAPFQPENADEWSTEKIVAQAIATNHTLNRVSIELVDGRDVTHEGGTLSVREEWLEAIIHAAGDLDGLVTFLRHSYGELLALADRCDEHKGSRKFHGSIFDGEGNIQLEAEMSFADIVTRYLMRHMRITRGRSSRWLRLVGLRDTGTPLHGPVNLAESLSTLDQLSRAVSLEAGGRRAHVVSNQCIAIAHNSSASAATVMSSVRTQCVRRIAWR